MGQTSIPCNSEVRDRLAGDKPDDMSWSEYLSVLHSDQEIVVEGDSNSPIDTTELEAKLSETASVVEEMDRDMRKLMELIERVPEQTADELGSKYV